MNDSRARIKAVLFAILLVGTALRFTGLTWGYHYYFHPDETRILLSVSDIRGDDGLKGLDPKFYAYGHLPIYLIKIFHWLAAKLPATLFPQGWEGMLLVGRILSALFSALTILTVFFLGRRLFSSEQAGLLSAALLSFAVLPIQAAHFLTVESLLTLLSVLGILQALKIREKPTLLNYTVFGLILGAALTTKMTAAFLIFPLLAAHFTAEKSELEINGSRRIPLLLWVPVVALAIVFLTQPYLWTLPGIVLHSVQAGKGVLGKAAFFFGTLFHAKEIAEQSALVSGRTVYPYTLQYLGTLPFFYPVKQLALYGAGIPLALLFFLGLILSVRSTIRERNKGMFILLSFLVPFFLLTSLLSVKFPRYLLPAYPLFAVVAAGEFLAWSLLAGRRRLRNAICWTVLAASAVYAFAFVTIYNREHPAVRASKWMIRNVPAGKVLANEGPWEAIKIPFAPYRQEIPKWTELEFLPYDQPDSIEKIEKLSGVLAKADYFLISTNRHYAPVARDPAKYPLTSRFYTLLFERGLGFELKKSFTSFPGFLGLYRRDLSADESFTVYDHPVCLVFQKEMALSQQQIRDKILAADPPSSPGELYSEIKTPRSGLYEALTLFFRWFVLVWILGTLFLPLGIYCAPGMPETAYGISRIFGLILPAYLCWALSSFHAVRYGPEAALAAVLIPAVPLALAWRKSGRSILERLLLDRGRFVLASEAVFLVTGLIFFAFRVTFPNIYWSESPMDFSILKTVDRSASFPPPDPWLSGFHLNYYYYGQYLVSFLSKVAGIGPEHAYNLGLILVPALTAFLLFGLLYRLSGRFTGGLLGAALCVLAGNLDNLFQVYQIAAGTHSKGFFDFFRTTHEVLPHTVHEYPLFTFMFQDLHAHLVSLPLVVTVVALAYALFQGAPEAGEKTSRRLLSLCLLYSLLLGTILVTNTWDFPVAAAFLLLAALGAAIWGRGKPEAVAAWSRDAAKRLTAVVAAVPLAFLFFMPYHTFHSSPVKGVGILTAGDLAESSRGTFLIFGLFLLISAVLLFRESAALVKDARTRLTTLALLGLAAAGGAGILLSGRTLFSAIALLLAAAALAVLFSGRNALRPELAFSLLVFLTALTILLFCDFFTIRDFLSEGTYKRMNTVFKFYYQAWVYLSVSSAFFLVAILGKSGRKGFVRRTLHYGFLFILLILGAGCFATYPLVWASRTKYHNSWDLAFKTPLTLDGFWYLYESDPHEYHAIRWLDRNACPKSTILESSDRDYIYEHARVSSMTGLSSVLGWWSHVEQREHWGDTEERKTDIRKIYRETPLEDVPLLLDKYGVRYIHVGKPEIGLYGEQVKNRFDSEPFRLVYENPDVGIYEFSRGVNRKTDEEIGPEPEGH